MNKYFGEIKEKGILPFIGVYDTFSALLASTYSKGLFVSGNSFAVSFYELPDIEFIA